MFAAISWVIFSFFSFIAFLISLPILVVGAMWIFQATKWRYIWENEFTNKFFALFSGIGNWVLNLFDANHYQIIDEERYRAENQFYSKPEKKEEKSDESNQSTAQNQTVNNVNSDWKTLDNNQQNVINNQDIWIDLSGHEINNSENQINN
jgi:cell division protein FtsI/penicillin-binding protein 2